MVGIESLNNYLQNGDSVGWIYENRGPSKLGTYLAEEKNNEKEKKNI